jgi:predicted lipid-binding transport protein (Tim44 family)
MSKVQIRFPRLCAWCGTRQPSATRKISIQRSQGRTTSTLKFEAPICEACEAHAAALEKASKQRTWAAIIGSFVVGMLLALVMFGLEEGTTLVMGIFFSFVIMIVALIVISIRKIKTRLNQRMVGEPPEAYASIDWQPCAMTGSRTLQFHSSAYQKQFAALNPGLVSKT